MILKEENDKLIFRFSFIRFSGVSPAFVTGNTLILLLKNNKQLEIKMTKPTSSFNGYIVLTDFEIKKEYLEDLSQSDITDIRVKSVFNPLDITIQNSTASYFKCFMDK